MRRATVLAIVLVMALAGAVQAKDPVAIVAGHYTYFVEPGNLREVTVTAHGTDPVTGTWSWTQVPSGWHLSGPVTCLVVDGPDAWMAGPSTDGNAAFLWVHDGGSPGSRGDTAVTWIADPGETLEDMEELCETQSSPLGLERFPVESGNLVVRPAR